jgi:hypothetical protein
MKREPAEEEPAEEEPAEEKADKNLVAAFGVRRIRLKGLRLPLKLVICLAIAQIALVAVLLAVHSVPQPLVSSAVLDQAGGTYAVPLAVFVVMALSVAVGYWFALAGALRVRTRVGVPIIALATWALADAPVATLRAAGAGIGPHRAEWQLRWAQLGVLAVLWMWVIWRAAAKRYGRAETSGASSEGQPKAGPVGQPWHSRLFTGAMAVILAYYVLEFAIWGAYARAGRAATGTGFLLDDLGVQAVLLPAFLVLVVLLGSTDLLEWGEITARAVASRARPRSVLLIVTPLTALAMIVNVVRLDGSNVLPELVTVGIPATILALVIRLAPGYGRWSDDVRSRAVLVGAIGIFAYTTVLPDITSAGVSALGWPPRLDVRVYSLVSIPVSLAILTAILWVLARGRASTAEQRVTGLFLAMVTMLVTIAAIPAFLTAARLPALFPQHHFGLVSGMRLVASLSVLAWVIRLAVRRQVRAAAKPMANAFLLLAGLQAVAWLLDLLTEISALGALSVLLLAGLFFLTVMWGFITSGGQLTGPDSNTPRYPQDGRVLLVVSYTLAANAVLLYLGSLRVAGTGAIAAGYLTADFVSPAGLGILGSSLVVAAYIVRMSHAPAGAVVTASPDQAGRPAAPVTVQFAVLGLGALATAIVLAFVLVNDLPELAHASSGLRAKPYIAAVPGPDCDKGGAHWSVAPGQPIAIGCGPKGLRVGAGPRAQGDLQFVPASGIFTQNYRVWVHVTFSRGFDGCATINTRSTAVGHYLNDICSDHSAAILRISPPSDAQLAEGPVEPAAGYTLEAISRGSSQRISVGGVTIGSAVDGQLSGTAFIGLGIINEGTIPGSVVFSDFEFERLPASPHGAPAGR